MDAPSPLPGDSDAPGIEIDPATLSAIRAIARTPGWTATAVVLMSGANALILTGGPIGRGHLRQSFLIVGDALPDAFRAVAAALSLIDRENDHATTRVEG